MKRRDFNESMINDFVCISVDSVPRKRFWRLDGFYRVQQFITNRFSANYVFAEVDDAGKNHNKVLIAFWTEPLLQFVWP